MFSKTNADKAFVHDTAVVDPGAVVGAGTKIWHFSHIMSGARIGERCVLGQNVFVANGSTLGDGVKVQNNVSIYSGVHLEDDVFCGPSMVFTNVKTPRAHIDRKHVFTETYVKQGATLGANCTVVCGVQIGRYAMVAAGAVVTKDVPDNALIMGVPGRITGWVCSCGEHLPGGPARAEYACCEVCGAEWIIDSASDGLVRLPS